MALLSLENLLCACVSVLELAKPVITSLARVFICMLRWLLQLHVIIDFDYCECMNSWNSIPKQANNNSLPFVLFSNVYFVFTYDKSWKIRRRWWQNVWFIYTLTFATIPQNHRKTVSFYVYIYIPSPPPPSFMLRAFWI